MAKGGGIDDRARLLLDLEVGAELSAVRVLVSAIRTQLAQPWGWRAGEPPAGALGGT